MKHTRFFFTITGIASVCGALATSTFACGLVIDPDILISGNGMGDPSNDGGNPPVNNDGGSDADPDAPIIDPNCKPTGAESCTDGIDNDCNGRIDCADSACKQVACVEKNPDGWTFIALAPDKQPACGTGFGQSTDVQVTGSLGCKCECGNNCGGSITLAQGTSSTCASGDMTFGISAACVSTPGAMFNLQGFASVTGGGGSGSCAPTNQTTGKSITAGRTCAPESAGLVGAAGGCGDGLICGLKPAVGFMQCVAKAGDDACPGSFTKRYATGVGAATDTRTCAGCACTNNACAVELELWSQPQCNGSADATLTSAACVSGPSPNNIKAFKSKATNGCVATTPSTTSGAVTFATNTLTVCCK